jgi:transposase-like protein
MSSDQNIAPIVRRKWLSQDKQCHYDAWKKSSLSRSKYCREHHIPISLFSKWVKKFENKKVSPLAFIPVETHSAPSSSDVSMELKFSNGLQCRFTCVTNVSLVLEIIQGINDVITHSK